MGLWKAIDMFKAFLLSTAAGLVLALAAPALADKNTLTIEQSGDGNSLYVDQSLATSSAVKGLSLDEPSLPGGGSGTLGFGFSDTASQQGQGNVGNIVLKGSGGTVRLMQDSTGASAGNEAYVNANDGASAIVGQSGGNNYARITATGVLSGLNPDGTLSAEFIDGQGGFAQGSGLTAEGRSVNAAILQSGSGNRAELTAPAGTQGTLVQIGDNNVNALDLNDTSFGSSVIYTQIGSGMQALTDVSVTTNASGTVAITQTNGVNTRGSVVVTQTAR